MDEELVAAPGEAHVWRAAFDLRRPPPERLVAVLSADERARAGRYRRLEDAYRFAAGRAFLRQVLSRYLPLDASAVEFDARCPFCGGAHGKPRVRFGDEGLDFSLARSHELAVVAVARGAVVGVDVELVRDWPAIANITPAMLSHEEERELASVPDPLRARQLLACWTRKEAVVKAAGRGLAIDPRSFSVTFLPGEDPCLRTAPVDVPEAREWSLAELDLGRDYVAALAVGGPLRAVRILEIEQVS